METPIILKTRAFVEELLSEKLPQGLFYHDLNHTREVVSYAEEVGNGEKLTPGELEIVILAAWLHDAGYTEQYVGHEEESQSIAEKFLLEQGYPEEKITIINNCIIATKFRHESGNVLEAVLIDADRMTMGKDNFIERGESLRREWEHYLEKEYTDLEWVEVQINYLHETEFLTPYCIVTYSDAKARNMKALRELKFRLDKDQNAITTTSRQSIIFLKKAVAAVFGSLLLGEFIGIALSITVWGTVGYSIGIGSIAGFIIGMMLYIFDPLFDRTIIRKYSFPVSLIVGTVVLILLFKASQYIAVAVYDLLVAEIRFSQIVESQVFRDIISLNNIYNMLWIAFMMSMILNFIKLTSRIIGPRMMLNYVWGKYHQPVEEERIFMFIDLNSSTSLAEKMGPVQYHEMLNSFFYDIAQPISRFNGEIYQYVGDEVVVTWKMKDGLKNSNCIRCFFGIEKQLKKLKPEYERKFGFMPEFKVGMHGGKVITGEVGRTKTEIVFHGDVINTTERILNQCITLGKKILISENLLRRLDLSTNIDPEYVTTKLFRGKENEVSLYTLTKEEKSPGQS